MVGDDERQKRARAAELAAAELVAIALPSLCELVWVLSHGMKSRSINLPTLSGASPMSANVGKPSSCRSRACCAGGCGGDFADGIIAYDGQAGWAAKTFVSFDEKAVKRLFVQNKAARLLG